MKKLLLSTLLLSSFIVTGCDSTPVIIVGATPSPHAEILKISAVQDYVKSKGYRLEVRVYQDWKPLNLALNDGSIDANYFQHNDYLTLDCNNYGYDLVSACQVHNEPLNLYSNHEVSDYSNQTIFIVNDVTNVERAFELLKSLDIISSYSVENFDASHPVYTSDKGVTIKCLDPVLLHNTVDRDDNLAVIPGNYALTAWGVEITSKYKIAGETELAAKPNVIAVKKENINDEKTNILVEALALNEVKTYINEKYGATVNYCYLDLR